MNSSRRSKDILQSYVERLTRLRRRATKELGPSPHKPLLLLTVIAMIENGRIRKNEIPCSREVDEMFCRHMAELTTREVETWEDIASPFFHLKNDQDEYGNGFWHLHAKQGCKKELEARQKVGHIGPIEKLVSHASLDDELFEILCDSVGREIIRQALIQKYFPHGQCASDEINAGEPETEEYSTRLVEEAGGPFEKMKTPGRLTTREVRIREAGFRRAIMTVYNHACAICELRIVTRDGRSATEAAHIIPYSESHNDDVRNGIALCRLHHWAFDQGLVSVGENDRVMVSGLMCEVRPTEWMLTELEEKPLQLPDKEQLRPAQGAMAWHREKIFRKN